MSSVSLFRVQRRSMLRRHRLDGNGMGMGLSLSISLAHSHSSKYRMVSRPTVYGVIKSNFTTNTANTSDNNPNSSTNNNTTPPPPPPQPTKPFYVTTPIFYVNGPPHLGHLYSAVVGDAVARWKRVCGRQAFFMTGTDEHGLKVQQAAKDAGESPKIYCDKISAQFQQLFSLASISPTTFSRTSSPTHAKVVHELWQRLVDNGFIYKAPHYGWYSKREECFVALSNVKITNEAQGLHDETGEVLSYVSEDNYKFKLSAFQSQLQQFLETNLTFVQPHALQKRMLTEVIAGLTDISISRLKNKVHWGVSVPGDPDSTVYVWMDALTVYLSAIAGDHGLWPPDVQVLGKDIVRFHSIYWPAFLMAAKLPLPKKLLVHGHWLVEGTKMSKSLGNVVDPFAVLNEWGADPVRYYMLHDGCLEDDSSFDSVHLVTVYHTLVDTLGNLLARTTGKLLPGASIPSWKPLIEEEYDRKKQEEEKEGKRSNADFTLVPLANPNAPTTTHAIIEIMQALPDQVKKEFDRHNFAGGIQEMIKALFEVNGYFHHNAPWILLKTNPERCANIMYVGLESVRIVAILLQPVIPTMCNAMLSSLRVPAEDRTFEHAKCFPYLKPGTPLDFSRSLLKSSLVLMNKFNIVTKKKHPGAKVQ